MASARYRDGKRGAAKALLGSAFALGAVALATPAAAQLGTPGPCTRQILQGVVDGYIAAQTDADFIKIPFSGWTQYNEQAEMSTMSTGILSKPLKIDFHRSLLDTTSCSTFTEVIVTDPSHPYVIGTMMSVREGRVGSIDTFVTDQGDWLFNAANTLKYSKAENWGVIPEAERDSRATIMAAANAYLDLFNDKNAVVPWGTPCARLEGGAYTGKGAPGTSTPQDSCNVGVPSGVPMVDRRYVVDETIGAVAVMLAMGKNRRPDIHTFRIEHGKIRYVHTITVCNEPNCGFPQTRPGQTPSQAAAARPSGG